MIRVNSQSFSLSSTLRKKNLNDNDIRVDHNNISKSQSYPVKHQSLPPPQRQHNQHQQHQQQLQQQQHHSNPQISDNLRLHHVTQRILASILPKREISPHDNDTDDIRSSFGPHNEAKLQDKYEKEVISMLEQKHGKNYRVFDLESCISVITLERICELCKHIDKWLNSGQDKVVVLQDREDRQRLGAAIAAYLEYLDICASSVSATTTMPRNKNRIVNNNNNPDDLHAQNAITKNWLDLDIFSMKKFLEDFIGPLRIPSHKRYLQYFSGLLSGKIKMNSSPLMLKYIAIESPPSWLQYNDIASDTDWNSFIKIYQGLSCVYTSDIHIIPITTRQFLYQIGNLQLRGDILIRCYQIVSGNSILNNGNTNGYVNGNREDTRELLFSLQFHTCAMYSQDVIFRKEDLDYAWCDNRFPKDCRITFHFNKSANSPPGNDNHNGYVFQSPMIRTEPPNALARCDSIERFDLSTKYQGPVDGSLYATILKSPKTTHYPTTPKRTTSTAVNVISPPPQFSNTIQRHHQHQFDTSTPIRQSGRHSVEPNRNSATSTTTTTSTSSVAHNNNSLNSRSLLRDVQSLPRSDYSYINESRPATSQSNYRPSGHQQQVSFVETTTTQRTSSGHQQHQQNGRESVRSPLTLSMDSGISSSGILRAQQGSSVSPSSFPSQASPQEDRHRELDDILSDMLMTVQDIPDFHSKNKHIAYRQQQQRSQSAAPTIPTKTSTTKIIHSATSLSTLPNSNNSSKSNNCNELKRSLSYAAYENGINQQQQQNLNPYLSKDLYETSSTTTTLTPPPSESGRDTPIQLPSQQQYCQQINRQQQDTIYCSSSMASSTNTLNSQATTTSRRNGGIDDFSYNNKIGQQQSSKYPQQVRTTTTTKTTTTNNNKSFRNCFSEDEDNSIPYHAREHSKPFTYGNVPNGHQLSETPVNVPDELDIIDTSVDLFDPAMIKAQSGLSSPSLVRKFSGGGIGSNGTLSSQSSTLRKTTPLRNDFEDMLRERREKVMSEKYLISDKTSPKWLNNTVNQTNGYHYYNEPLKRANTLDGFYRSNSTDGLSGQTWLQLQQQKLRAKKGQQLRDERHYFEEIHTEMRNRPQRSNGFHRYDGYASDTAAFGDEIDYRRPIHVQMPYNNRSPSERKYNTITTTTTTSSMSNNSNNNNNNKERPFVAVKRAHDLAKREAVGSPPLSPLQILNASPTGHIINPNNNNNNTNNQKQNGLLSMADSPTSPSSSRNGQKILESDLKANDNSTTSCTTACTNVHNNNNNYHNNINSHNSITSNANNHVNHHNNNNHNNNNAQLAAINGGTTTTSTVVTNCYNSNNNNNNSSIGDDTSLCSSDSLNSIAINGQLALDRLLESLAIESDLMNKQLAKVKTNENQKNSNQITNLLNGNHKQLLSNNDEDVNKNFIIANGQQTKTQDLNDVLAELNEFTRIEEIRKRMEFQSTNTNGGGNHLHQTTNGGGCYSDSVISNNSNSSNSPINGNNRRLIAAVASESEENSSSISPSFSERSNHALWNDQTREESFSSYRSETDQELSMAGSPRPETPAFPTTPRTPYGFANGSVSPALPPKSPTSQRRFNNSSWSLRSQKSTASNVDVSKDLFSSGTHQKGHVEFVNQNDQFNYPTQRRNSNSSQTNSEPQEIAPHLVKFVRDSSKYWYKPTISREEAIALLRHAQPGTFIVRDSTTFKNAFGLVLRVAHPPPGVTLKPGGDELVRHFLVEPTSRGVRLKGCANEPVFSSLSALVYQHSLTPLALPCRLVIPDSDIQAVEIHTPAQKQLLTQGAACNVLYLFACDTESLTGEEAVRRAVCQLYANKPLPTPTEVHFKVSQQGITLTDNTRQKFFRKHYANHIVSFCGFDPDRRTWSIKTEGDFPVQNKTIFAFVARRSSSSTDNTCHVFCDLAPNQPATAIVSFVNKVLPTEKAINHHI